MALNRKGAPAILGADSEGAGGSLVRGILTRFDLSPADLAKYLGTSLVSVVRWERGDTKPDSRMQAKLTEISARLERGELLNVGKAVSMHVFAARGARHGTSSLPLFRQARAIELEANPKAPILSRLRSG